MQKTKFCSIIAIVAAMLAITPAFAADWHASVGAQSTDKSRQALAFLPNELWIHAGDSITWNFNADDIHTITFLKARQVRPAFPVGCPGFTVGSGIFDGSTCLSTPPFTSGQTFSVQFPRSGNYKLVCLVHEDMTATVHVLPTSVALPYTQAYYDRQAAQQTQYLLSADGLLEGHQHFSGPHQVAVGVGQVVATGGGHDTISVMRFLQPELVIHAGTLVEWTNYDSITPHTITFGTEPAGDPSIPSANVTVGIDGALKATISSTSDSVHSGFIISAPQERLGLAQAPLGHTRFRIRFTKPGVYPYICALHDNLGMKGRIVVLP
jgi:plastocyanin